MGRNAQPVGLLKAKGKSHLSKAEIERREETELKVPFTNVHPPEYLSAKQKDVFNRYAEMLLALNVFTELDEECLARYVCEEDVVKAARRNLNKAQGDDMKDAEIMYDKAVKRIRMLASDLGLTPTSRCKLSIPPPPEEDDEL